jgi:hypothetical protein
VSETKTKRGSSGGNALVNRARGVVVMAVPVGQRAGGAAACGMRRGAHHARRWSAPRLEALADAVETSITPFFTSKLRQGAGIVRPEQESRLAVIRRSARGWRGLVGLLVLLGAAGAAAGFLVRKRLNEAIMEEELIVAENAETDGVAVPAQAASDSDETAAQDRKISTSW